MRASIARVAVLLCLAMVSPGAPLAAGARIETKRGTATVIDVRADRVIIASDSRVTVAGGYRDDDCKISALDGEMVFSGAGYREISSATPPWAWDSHEVALKSFRLAKSKHAADIVSATAREWERETKEFFAGPPDGLRDLLDGGVSDIFDAVFVGKDADGRLSAFHDNVRIDPAGPAVEITSDALHSPSLLVLGVKDIAEEFANKTSPRAIAETAEWRETVSTKDASKQETLFAAQLVKWTILYGPRNVGGAVHTVTFDSSGVHWIDEKDGCKDRP
jgi:hypothetical protein